MAFLKFWDRLIWLIVLVLIAAFFLPWVRVDADIMRPLAKIEEAGFGNLISKIRGEITAATRSIEKQTGYSIPTEGKVEANGFDIPRLVNTNDTQLALSFVQLFTKKTEGVQWKCYAVYSIPGLAVLLALLYQFARRPRWGKIRMVPCLVTLFTAALFFIAYLKITTAELDHLVLEIKIGFGLWLSLFAYGALAATFGLGTLSMCFIRDRVRLKK
jgi:hypothetical protein